MVCKKKCLQPISTFLSNIWTVRYKQSSYRCYIKHILTAKLFWLEWNFTLILIKYKTLIYSTWLNIFKYRSTSRTFQGRFIFQVAGFLICSCVFVKQCNVVRDGQSGLLEFIKSIITATPNICIMQYQSIDIVPYATL